MYVNPAAAVAVFVLNKRGELLVCERARDPHSGTLDLPGGFVDDQETAEEAVHRELNEELQLDAGKPVYLFSLPNKYLYSGWTLPTLDMFYLVHTIGNEQLVAADDVASCFYVSPEKLDPEGFGLSSIRKAVSIFKSDLINNRLTSR